MGICNSSTKEGETQHNTWKYATTSEGMYAKVHSAIDDLERRQFNLVTIPSNWHSTLIDHIHSHIKARVEVDGGVEVYPGVTVALVETASDEWVPNPFHFSRHCFLLFSSHSPHHFLHSLLLQTWSVIALALLIKPATLITIHPILNNRLIPTELVIDRVQLAVQHLEVGRVHRKEYLAVIEMRMEYRDRWQ